MVILNSLHFPNAIYIDSVDHNGLIRTGTGLFGPASARAAASDPGNVQTGYAYADTIVLYNVRRICSALPVALVPPECALLTTLLAQRRALNPFATWSDPAYGRLVGWPFAP